MATHSHIDLSNPDRYRASMRVTLVSVVVNLLFTAIQIVVGIVGHSQALVADGFHTLSDLLADILVLFALLHGRREADEVHPYGHARIETAVTLILGLILVVVGIGVAVNTGVKFLQGQAFATPAAITLWVALATLAVKETMYQYTMRVARRFDSNMLRASAWHHRSDAVSSLVVVAGIGGALIGFAYVDSIAAVIVAGLIVKIGVEFSWRALRELVDTGLSHGDLESIRRTILGISGVKALHMLRTRQVGERALADVHIIVDENLSVSEGHQIGDVVRAKLIREHSITDVTVHIDTEEDVEHPSCEGLPLRDEVLRRLRDYFAPIPQANHIERTTLHYTNGRIVVEVVLPLSTAPNVEEAHALVACLNAAVRRDSDIQSISVLFH